MYIYDIRNCSVLNSCLYSTKYYESFILTILLPELLVGKFFFKNIFLYNGYFFLLGLAHQYLTFLSHFGSNTVSLELHSLQSHLLMTETSGGSPGWNQYIFDFMV